MEGSPLNSTDNSEKKESSGKKKNVKAIGGYAVEPKLPATKPETKPDAADPVDRSPLEGAETKSGSRSLCRLNL